MINTFFLVGIVICAVGLLLGMLLMTVALVFPDRSPLDIKKSGRLCIYAFLLATLFYTILLFLNRA